MSATPELTPPLTDPFSIGGVEIENRVLLAPLAGIGNWFVRMQARRHGAGMAVSEMVSSFAIRHGNRRTLEEMLRIEPEEHPVSVQLFGPDPDVMRGAAATVAEAGADIVDLNMGCPVPKVCKTGAGAALIGDPARAVAVASAAREGSGLPVTVKVRSGLEPGDRSGFDLAVRLAEEAGVDAIGFHPRGASVHHKGAPGLRARPRAARARADVPDDHLRRPQHRRAGAPRLRGLGRRRGDDRPRLARQPVGLRGAHRPLATGRRHARRSPPSCGGCSRAARHWGAQRAARNLRKFYPWYLERLGIAGRPPTPSSAPRASKRSANCSRGRSKMPAPAFLGPRVRLAIILRLLPLPAAPDGLERAFAPKGGRHCGAGSSKGEVGPSEPRVADNQGRPREAQGRGGAPLDGQAPRGCRAHQGSARVRRHHGELGVRRREERAGDARAADRAARGPPAPLERDRGEGRRERRVDVGVTVHVKDQKSGNSRKFQIVGATEAQPPDKLSNESPVGKALSATSAATSSPSRSRAGPKRKLKITKIEAPRRF